MKTTALIILTAALLIQSLRAHFAVERTKDLQWAIARDCWLLENPPPPDTLNHHRHSPLQRAMSDLWRNPNDPYALSVIHRCRLITTN